MKTYQSHKKVQASKIVGINIYTLELDSDTHQFWSVSHGWYQKHNPQVGGYLVIYPDGYESFSPAKAFEEGYTECK